MVTRTFGSKSQNPVYGTGGQSSTPASKPTGKPMQIAPDPKPVYTAPVYVPPPPTPAQQAAAQQRLAPAPQTTVYDAPPPPPPAPAPAPVVEPPAPKIDPKVDYLKEAGYVAQVGALEEALKNFTAQDTADRQRYDVDFDSGLRDLGFRDNTPDIATDNLDDLNNGARNWDWNDVLSASGRGYQSNVNDFAARGMLQSQGYADSIDNLKRSLDTQRDSMATGRTTFRQGQTDAATNYGVQNTAAKNAAMVDAIARLEAQMGIG